MDSLLFVLLRLRLRSDINNARRRPTIRPVNPYLKPAAHLWHNYGLDGRPVRRADLVTRQGEEYPARADRLRESHAAQPSDNVTNRVPRTRLPLEWFEDTHSRIPVSVQQQTEVRDSIRQHFALVWSQRAPSPTMPKFRLTEQSSLITSRDVQPVELANQPGPNDDEP